MQGADRQRILVCREIDTNLDGIKDVVRTFNEKGEALREEADYRPLVPPACLLLCGGDFALLRPGFAELRRAPPPKASPMRGGLGAGGGTAGGPGGAGGGSGSWPCCTRRMSRAARPRASA